MAKILLPAKLSPANMAVVRAPVFADGHHRNNSVSTGAGRMRAERQKLKF
jgi:hypothetical protein